jgi:hypothetical protein
VKNFIEKHKWEIIFAFAFELIAYFTFDKIKELLSSLHPFVLMLIVFLIAPFLVSIIVNKIKKIGEQTFHEKEIKNSIRSNYYQDILPMFLTEAVKKHNALIKNNSFHYQNMSGKYHVRRRFKLLPITLESVFPIMCKCISSKCDLNDVDCIISIDKESNRLFVHNFSNNCPRGIKTHYLFYDEDNSRIKYTESESLEGVKVILLESLIIFPEPIIAAINLIKEQRAILKNIVILFDSSSAVFDLASCGIEKEDVIIANSIDLKLSLTNDCGCDINTVKLKTLKYNEY